MNSNKDFLKSALYYGLLMAGAFMLIDLLLYVFDLSGLGIMFGLLVLLIIVAMYFVFFIKGGRKYRNQYMGGYMNYGKAFLFCLIMVGVYVLLMLVYNFLFYIFFDPQRAINEMQKAAEMIQENSYIPDDQKEIQIKKILDNGTGLNIVLRNFMSNTITGLVLGAISALFIRKKEKISEVF
jgi:hypothetical protein